MRPTTKGGYQPGAGGPLGGHGASELGRAAAGRWSEKWDAPNRVGLTIALNAGKRQLHAYAYGEYDRIFIPLRERWEQRRRNLNTLRNNAKDAEKTIRRIIREERASKGGGLFGRIGGFGQERIHQIAQGLLNPEEGGNRAWRNAGNRDELDRQFRIFDMWFQARESFEKDFQKDLESCSARLSKYLEDKADIVAVRVARQQKIPLNSPDQVDLKKELKGYAQELAENLITRGNTMFQAMLRGLAIVSREGGTTSELWQNLLSNLWGIITGPWVMGSGIVILQFFFMTSWSGGLAGGWDWKFIIAMPAFMALLLLILNIESTKTQMPLDFLTHIISGAMIGYSTIIFMMAIATPELINQQLIASLAIWFFLAVFIGAFQVYKSGGFVPVFAASVVILIFGFIALGPYNGYYSVAVDQVKTPLGMAWVKIKAGLEELWLLGTNPTEWARVQQEKNLRPEKPVDIPKALEITGFDLMPSDGIPASTPNMPMYFAAAVTLHNRGDMAASSIALSADCNSFCNTSEMLVTPSSISDMKPNEGNVVQFTKLRSWVPTKGREAEFKSAVVTINASYRYSTASALPVTIMSEKEINKQMTEGKDIFKPVTAVGKGTPASLSLNVGPQPLFPGRNSLLLVSVYTTRDDGYIILDPPSQNTGTKIRIHLPSSIGSGLSCSGCSPTANEEESGVKVGEMTECSPSAHVEIKPSEFKTTYSILCNFFTASNVDITKTDIIRAEMPNYTFILRNSKNIKISPPLGILNLNSSQTAPPPVPTGSAVRIIYDVAAGNDDLYRVMAVGAYLESTWNERARVVDNNGAESCGLFQFNVRGHGLPRDPCKDPDESLRCTCWLDHPKEEAEIIKPDYLDKMNNANTLAKYSADWYCYIWKNAERNAADCSSVSTLNRVNSAVQELQKLSAASSGDAVKNLINPLGTVSCQNSDYASNRGDEGVCIGAYNPATRACGGRWIHGSIDITAAKGTTIKAALGGTVESVENDPNNPGGKNIVIKTTTSGEDWRTYYAHLDTIAVTSGQNVLQGEKIGEVGNTGIWADPRTTMPEHLHFSVYKGSDYRDECSHIDPCYVCGCADPAPYGPVKKTLYCLS